MSEVKRLQSLEFAGPAVYSPIVPHRVPLSVIFMLPTRLLRVALVVFVAFALACDYNALPPATYANPLGTYTLTPLTNGSNFEPNAIGFLTGSSRANSSFTFDVAFDVDPTGVPLAYPVRSLGGALAGGLKRVGLQLLDTAFDAQRIVPSTGYDTLTVQKLKIGRTVAVQMLDNNACFNATLLTTQLLYAKFVVDSVNVAGKRIYVRTVTDPNCGYRSVVPDSVPKTPDAP